MNKHKEKHHLQEEVKKGAPGPDKPFNTGGETVQEIPAEQKVQPQVELSEGDPGYADSPSQSAMAERGARKLVKAEDEIAQLKDQLLRLRADFENYRKRVLREKAEVYENANEPLMLELLPVMDHLQIAVKSARESKADHAFREGMQLILDQLTRILLKYGLAAFDSGKQTFDHNLHEAISSIPSETEPEGMIIAQSRPGYRFKNKLLRPAQVVVSSGKPAPAQPEANNQPAEE